MPVCFCYVCAYMYVFMLIHVGCTWLYVHKESRTQAWVWFPRHHLPFSLSWKESLTYLGGACQEAGLADSGSRALPVFSSVLGLQEHAIVPGFTTWLLVIKLRSTTEAFPQYLSICLFLLQISNPFVYLNLTWWYRKSPDNLSPQWAWKFLYLTPCFSIHCNRWCNMKALLLPRPCIGMDPLYRMTSSQDIPSLLYNSPVLHLFIPAGHFTDHFLSLYITVTVFIHIQKSTLNCVHSWYIIFSVIISPYVYRWLHISNSII